MRVLVVNPDLRIVPDCRACLLFGRDEFDRMICLVDDQEVLPLVNARWCSAQQLEIDEGARDGG